MAVLLIHTCYGGMWQVLCRPFINFAVAMFLFLSGYLTNIKNDNWFALYKKRITRVIIPYIIWTGLYLLPHITPKRFLLNLFTAGSAATLYYILVYVQLVVLTPLLGRMANSKWQWVGWIVSPISVILFKYYWLLSGNTINHYVGLIWGISCLGWFTFYYLGLLLGNNLLHHIRFDIRTIFLLYILSILLQMAEGYGWLLLGVVNCGSQTKLTSFLTSSLFLILSYCYLIDDNIHSRRGLLSFIGDYSFGIYLSHIMVQRLLSQFLPYYSCIPFPINTLIVLVISLLFVWVGNKICGERISKWMGFV